MKTFTLTEVSAQTDAILEVASNEPVAIIEADAPIAYIVPAAQWEAMQGVRVHSLKTAPQSDLDLLARACDEIITGKYEPD